MLKIGHRDGLGAITLPQLVAGTPRRHTSAAYGAGRAVSTCLAERPGTRSGSQHPIGTIT